MTVPRSSESAPQRAPVPASVVDGTARAERCPRCGGALTLRHGELTDVAACRAGHGVFLSHAALEALERAASAGAEVARIDGAASAATARGPDEVVKTLMCPRCGEPMTRRARPRAGTSHTNVVVDVCEVHGTWFDAGELRQSVGASRPAPSDAPSGASGDDARAKATLDVALALENARDEDTARRGIAIAEDLLDLFVGPRIRRGRWL